MSTGDQIDGAENPITAMDKHRAIIVRAVALAAESIAQAMTAETYATLASLKSTPSTHGEYLQAISDLKVANKAIRQRDIDRGVKAVTANSAVDQPPKKLRKPDDREAATIYKNGTTIMSKFEGGDLPPTTSTEPKKTRTPYEKGSLSQLPGSRTTLIEHAEHLVIDMKGQLPESGIKFGVLHQLHGKTSNGVLCKSIIVSDVNATYIDLDDGIVVTVDQNGGRALYFMGSSPE